MQAKCAGWAHGLDGSQERAADSFFLEHSRDSAKDCATGEQSRHGNGERSGGHLAERSEAPVINLLLAAPHIEMDDLHCEWIVKVGRRIIKGKMAVGADATTDDINGRGIEPGSIFGCRLGGIVAGVEHMHGSEGGR